MASRRPHTPVVDVARLWAPWRSAFLLQRKPRSCIFCAAKRSTDGRSRYVLNRGTAAFALLNRYPYTNGHLLVAPYRHVGRLTALSQNEWLDLWRLTQQWTSRLIEVLHPHGFNIGVNVGRVAGAGVPGHLHLHVVPRWNGDTNFMPVVAHTRLISQSLDEVYTLLTGASARRRSRRPS